MSEFFFQIVLFLAGAAIGVAVPLLPDSQKKRAAGILAVSLIAISLVWAGYELGNVQATPPPIVTDTLSPITGTISPQARSNLSSWKPTFPPSVELINTPTAEAYAVVNATHEAYEPTEVAIRLARIPQIEGYAVVDEAQMEVSPEQGWQDTGITFSPGQIVLVSYLSGVWGFAQADRNYGDGNPNYCCSNLTGYGGEKANWGTLMGRIGEQASFTVGSYFYKQITDQGNLFLRINDDILRDNYGSLKIITLKYSK